MKSSNGRADKILGKTVEIVGLAKEFVGSAVSAVPPAAVAWAGVCLLLPVCYFISQGCSLALLAPTFTELMIMFY